MDRECVQAAEPPVRRRDLWSAFDLPLVLLVKVSGGPKLAGGLKLFNVVATEGAAHDGDHAIGEVVLFARPQAANQRLRDNGSRDVEVDGFGNGPGTFP